MFVTCKMDTALGSAWTAVHDFTTIPQHKKEVNFME